MTKLFLKLYPECDRFCVRYLHSLNSPGIEDHINELTEAKFAIVVTIFLIKSIHELFFAASNFFEV